ncbi:hypothetical protein F2P79_001859 [Pimephales promelas]|nr:hypothetical protein F2P79_001859 [Pimephales promelas]
MKNTGAKEDEGGICTGRESAHLKALSIHNCSLCCQNERTHSSGGMTSHPLLAWHCPLSVSISYCLLSLKGSRTSDRYSV